MKRTNLQWKSSMSESSRRETNVENSVVMFTSAGTLAQQIGEGQSSENEPGEIRPSIFVGDCRRAERLVQEHSEDERTYG